MLYIPGVSPTHVAELPTCLNGKALKVLHTALEAISWFSKAHFLILPSMYELEASPRHPCLERKSCGTNIS